MSPFNNKLALTLFLSCTSLFLLQAQKECVYVFENNFKADNSSFPTLTALGTQGRFIKEALPELDGIERIVYEFDKNAGLSFDNAAAKNFLSNSYSIELYFRFDELNSWKRVIDWKYRTMDQGAYIYNGKLNFYKIITSDLAPVSEGDYTHYIITRDEASKRVNIYADGVSKIEFIDKGDLAVIGPDNQLNFFRDDLIVRNEASAGAVAFIKLYDHVITPEKALNSFKDFGTRLAHDDKIAISALTPVEPHLEEFEETDSINDTQGTSTEVVTERSRNIKVVGKILNGETNQPTNGVVHFETENIHANSMYGIFTAKLSKGKNTVMRIEAKGFIPIDTVLDIKDNMALSFKMRPFKAGSKFKLKNIHFEQSKAEITSDSQKSLDRLVKLLIDNPTLNIEVGGHTDIIGDPILNMRLSRSRADVVKDYLVKHGIDESRLASKGYGSSRPLNNNGSEASRKLNRRVECTVLKL